MRVIINAGHSKYDSGVVNGEHKEADLAMEIRDELVKLIPDALVVPDDLNLRQSIDWVNSYWTDDSLAVSIHLNHNSNPHVRGVEAYYAQNDEIATVFAREVAEAQGIPNRGARHDSETYVGSLGWLRQIPKAVLVEGLYLSNKEDHDQYDPKKIAKGLYNAIQTQKQINWLKRQIQALINRIQALLLGKK